MRGQACGKSVNKTVAAWGPRAVLLMVSPFQARTQPGVQVCVFAGGRGGQGQCRGWNEQEVAEGRI